MDRDQPELVDGVVKVHPAVGRIMRECGEGGWISAFFPLSENGEQMPITVNNCCRYILAAANYSASVYSELTTGAAHLIIAFGSPELKETYVPNMINGIWQGTMGLTEPQAGSSLSDLATTAVPQEDGTYTIKGQKIFISGGDHDAVDNVIHLVLGRIEGAPQGVKGISLFIVPKKRVEKDGSLIPNDVTVTQVFHKLGYKGSPITELSFGDRNACTGYLVGQPHMGLSYMFQMMNEARLGVGMGATGIASAAYYASLAYAETRLQGRKLTEKDPAMPQTPIISHPDVKRMLLFQKAVVEGSLSLLLQCSMYADLEKTQEGYAKEHHALLLDILTPVAKSYPSEMGILSVSQGLQCLGGYGYCTDFPLEQYYRDARIHPIHEGTTGIQGMDLLGRKVTMKDGRAFEIFLSEVGKTIYEAKNEESLDPFADKLDEALRRLRKTTGRLVSVSKSKGPEAFLADGTLYLEMFGITTVAWQWLKQAIAATRALGKNPSRNDALFYQGKLHALRYFFGYELPKTLGLAARLNDTDTVTIAMQPEFFKD
jgi:butyryl-CoA dehydrogenase